MSGQDLYQERIVIMEQLTSAMTILKGRGITLAEKERTYRILKAKMIVKLRDEKTPVTIISDLVKGDENISLLAFERDCADVLYTSAKEAINILKKQLDVLTGDIENERRGQ